MKNVLALPRTEVIMEGKGRVECRSEDGTWISRLVTTGPADQQSRILGGFGECRFPSFVGG